MSLLILLHHFLFHHGRADALVAVTVDHALRPQSAQEARFVAGFCTERQIRHITKIWSDPKPATGLAAAARAARYRLLIEAAGDVGADCILTGHTADDQAETVFMRAERGAGLGLAGMAPETLLDGSVWLLRPLLGLGRDALRAVLREHSVAWIEDPSNDNPAAERVRARQAMTAERRARMLEQAQAAAWERRDLGQRAAVLVREHFSVAGDAVRVAEAFLHETDRDGALHAFRTLLCALGRQAHWPDAQRAAALYDALAQPGFSGSLGGCVAAHRRAGITLRLERRGKAALEPRAAITMMFAGAALRAIVPDFDLAISSALAELLGARSFPAAPGASAKCSIPLTHRA